MNEWGVVVVIIALAGLLTTIIKPVVSLTRSITSLDDSVKTLKEAIDRNQQENKDDHKNIWKKEDEQDTRIGNHEDRIQSLEKGK